MGKKILYIAKTLLAHILLLGLLTSTLRRYIQEIIMLVRNIFSLFTSHDFQNVLAGISLQHTEMINLKVWFAFIFSG